MNRLLTIDRIEGDTAVCLDDEKKRSLLPLSQLPPNAKEGDCLTETSTGWVLDLEETNRRRQRNQALFQRLLKKRPPTS